MDTIDLECPRCRESLSLDAGFAGGVCRCSTCGTLMTVPANTDQQAEEVIRRKRPARPGAPAQEATKPERPDRPDKQDPPSKPDRPARPDRPTSPSASRKSEPAPKPETSPAKPVKKKVAKSPEEKTPKQEEALVVDEGDELVTASGKKIDIAVGQAIPTASKRKLLIARVSTIAVVGGVVLVFAVVAIFAIISMMRSAEITGPTLEELQQRAYEREAAYARMNFQYNPTVSPYTMTLPNIMGFSIRGRTLVIVDASSGSLNWLELVTDALVIGLDREPPVQADVQVVFANSGEDLIVKKKAGAGLTEQAVESIQSAKAASQLALLEALEQGLEQKPEQVILVAGAQMRSAGDIKKWEALLTQGREQVTPDESINGEKVDRPAFVFNVLLIGVDDLDWDHLAREYDGHYDWHPLSRLRGWHQATQASDH